VVALMAYCAFEASQIITSVTRGKDESFSTSSFSPDEQIVMPLPASNATASTALQTTKNETLPLQPVALSLLVPAATNVPDSVKTASDNLVTSKNTTARLWEASTTIPPWMKDYFAWHQDQVSRHLSQDNWQSHRYLVMRCLEHETCGGASDRLQSVLKMLRLASLAKRLLFIKWTRPARLEEFLVPPVGGMNWTIPVWLDALLDYRSPIQKDTAISSSRRLVMVKDQTHDHGFHSYNQAARNATIAGNNEEEADFDQVFRDAWNVLFTPAPPVQALIDHNMNELDLVPGQYVAVHVRSKYKVDKSNDKRMMHNSINCASTMRPGWPIYFAADSSNATKHAVQYAQIVKNVSIAFRQSDVEPLHLDRGRSGGSSGDAIIKASNGWRNNTASDFYDVFVDLYMLANSACSTTGIGGFGKWAARMSFNASCIVRHDRNQCPWTPPPPTPLPPNAAAVGAAGVVAE
jgi:hypothetical protein